MGCASVWGGGWGWGLHLRGRSGDLSGLKLYDKALFSVSHVNLHSFKENYQNKIKPDCSAPCLCHWGLVAVFVAQ